MNRRRRRAARKLALAEQRSQVLLQEQRVRIIYLDNAQRKVIVQAHDQQRDYQIIVSARFEGRDSCQCDFCGQHRICQHIIAVLDLLTQQHRPLIELFAPLTDDCQFKQRYPENYRVISAAFEAWLADHPKQAAVIFADKQLYDRLRSVPDWVTAHVNDPVEISFSALQIQTDLAEFALPPTMRYRSADLAVLAAAEQQLFVSINAYLDN
ncbi:MAG: hypothetical protein L0H66_03805 [Loigolactobacillus coryniformis]|nr:hypothetical protein [Loigolactobacillus coryniformis]